MLSCTHEDALSTKGITVIRTLGARIHLELTVAARPTLGTGALIRGNIIGTSAAVHARRRGTLVRVDLAVVAAVAISTHTGVGVPVVEARAPIDAWH